MTVIILIQFFQIKKQNESKLTIEKGNDLAKSSKISHTHKAKNRIIDTIDILIKTKKNYLNHVNIQILFLDDDDNKQNQILLINNFIKFQSINNNNGRYKYSM